MRIDSKIVKAERKKRAWSQQHLASVAGLGLRTIQRIEANGVASYDSLQAIASCLEIDITKLQVSKTWLSTLGRGLRCRRSMISVILALLATAFGMFTFQSALAEQVLLDLGVTKARDNDTREFVTQILLNNGESHEMKMDGAFKLDISTTVIDDKKIHIAIKLFDYKNDEYVLVSEPKILTSSGKEATVQIGTDDVSAGYFNIQITAQIKK